MKKNFSFKAFFITAKAFVKKNVLSCLCLLLATLVAITGSISYSKYISSSPITEAPGAGSFSASASIDGVSALSFTNTAFWGGTVADDKIAMNALRSVDFSVKNYQIDSSGNKKVADVKMKYNLIFSAPVNFAERLAMQVFNSEGQPMLPQIILKDLIDSAQKGAVYNTANNTDDYNSAPCDDIAFNTQFGTSDGFITISATSDKAVIRLEEFKREVHQSLLFRMWDTSPLTSVTSPVLDAEGGKLLPPLTVNYKQMVNFYRITISMPEFVLPAGVETVVDYSIQLAPTNTIQDLHLGGEFVDSKSVNSAHVTSIYGPRDGVTDRELWTLRTVHEVQNDLYYSAFNEVNNTFSNPIIEGSAQKQDRSEYNIMGSPKVYNVGDTTSTHVSYQSVDDSGILTDEVDWENLPGWETDSSGTVTPPTEDEWKTVNDSTATPTVTPGGTGWDWSADTNKYYVGQTTNRITVVEDQQTRRVTVYKVPYTKTFTKTGEKTEKITANRGEIITTDTEVSEDTKVLTVSDGKETINICVKKTTNVKVSKTPYTQTATRTTTQNITYTLTGYRYYAYYNSESRNSVPTSNANALQYTRTGSVSIGGTSYSIVTNDSNPPEIAWNYANVKDEKTGEPTTGEITVGDLTAGSQTPDPVNSSTEYIHRKLERSFNYDDITIESVTWQQRDAAGNPMYDPNNNKPILNTYVYNDNPLTFFKEETGTDANGNTITANVQQLYLSQCYSKNYPFYVNVVFEQVLE